MKDINIIKLNGKPLEKLIQAIKDGCGKFYMPTAIRNEAKAEADALIIMAEGKALAEAKYNETKFKSSNYLKRLESLQEERDENINRVTCYSAEQLEGRQVISEEPVSKDWSRRFFNIVQDISVREMQVIWGRLLAGEIKSPGSFSLRTLELLKNLSHSEALLFQKVASYRLEGGSIAFIPRNEFIGLDYLKNKYLIEAETVLDLDHCGLVNSSSDITITLNNPQNTKEQDIFRYGNIGLSITREEGAGTKLISCWPFTESGKEIAQLIEFAEDKSYLDYLKKMIEDKVTKVNYVIIQEYAKDTGVYQVAPIDDFDVTTINN